MKHSVLKTSKGFGIVESLMAVVIISTAALGIGTVVNQVMFMVNRSLSMNNALSLQTEIIAALQDPEQFRTSPQLPQLRSLASETSTSLVNGVELRSASGQLIAVSGQRLGFDLNMNTCDPTSEDCILRVDFGISCGDSKGCRAAYRISFSPKYQDIQKAPVGASAEGAFVVSDYIIPISYEVISKASGDYCDPSNADVFMTGVTRDTGQVTCVRRGEAVCPAGTVAERLAINGGRLEFVCRPLAQARCPADYVWQSVDLAQLDNGAGGGTMSGATGTCVYRYRNNIPWQAAWPTGKHSVSGVFCNPDIYDAVPTGGCQAIVTAVRDGTCGYPSVSVAQSVSGGTVRCTIVKNQACGAAIDAWVYWSGTCRIKVPETVAPL